MSKPPITSQSSAPRPLRIGIDCRMFSSAFTGIGRYTYELVTRFIKYNDSLPAPNKIVLFFNDKHEAKQGSNNLTHAESAAGRKERSLFHSELPASPHIEKILVNAKHYSLREQTTFAYKLYKARLDLVHFPHFNVPILYRRPYVLTIHDLILSLFPGKKMNKWYHRLAYNLTIKNATRSAKKIIAVSKSTKSDLEKLMKIPAEKVEVIYNGISPIFRPINGGANRHGEVPTTASSASTDLQKVAATLKKYQITQPFFLYTGVWRNHKNLVNLIEAFSEFLKTNGLSEPFSPGIPAPGRPGNTPGLHSNLPKIGNSESRKVNHLSQANISPQGPPPASTRSLRSLAPAAPLLVLTGRPDPHYPEILAAIKSHHLENRIITPGLVSEEELVHLYNAAQIYVFPSLYEGFGLPPLEAMACGTPVAASSASCIPEICGEENALFFNPRDPQDIAKKLTRLYNNNELQSSLSARGLNHAKSFSWDSSAQKTWKVLITNLPQTHV